MTIAVLGATGMVGSRVITEAGARGHRVLALSRKPASEDPNVTPIAVDANDSYAVREALAGSASNGVSNGALNGVSNGAVDAVVLTVRTVPVDQGFLVGVTRTVLDVAVQLRVADNRAYVPAELKAVAAAGTAQLRTCQAHADADWVYLSPPALLEPGERTGRYRRGTDTLLTGADGRSWISALASAQDAPRETSRLVTPAAAAGSRGRSGQVCLGETRGGHEGAQ
ncbi:NAD(P)-dependent oxidoreductase [Streptomyces mirabilis]|uniref:NAD(P)-dependent oxidoreductase n=1 Tax=Streptomyces mirabilis TaxID=68239 RepID=UPI00341608EB